MNSTYSLSIENLPIPNPKFYQLLVETKDWSNNEEIQNFILGSIANGKATINLIHTQESISI